MTKAEPTPEDRHAKSQLNELIAYADRTGQTLLAAMLSEAADVLNENLFINRPDAD